MKGGKDQLLKKGPELHSIGQGGPVRGLPLPSIIDNWAFGHLLGRAGKVLVSNFGMSLSLTLVLQTEGKEKKPHIEGFVLWSRGE